MDAGQAGTGTVLAVCRVHALLPTRDSTGVSAIDKRPGSGPLEVHGLGVSGDIQANRIHHGGPDQAVYAYAQEEADDWAAELGRPIEPGLFGENLRLQGMAVTDAVIGERWRVGGTVVLETTSPRIPCGNFQQRMGEPQWVRRFTDKGHVGTYLRVITKGRIAAGDPVEVIARPAHGITIREWFTRPSTTAAEALLAAHEAGDIRLQDDYRPYFRKILA